MTLLAPPASATSAPLDDLDRSAIAAYLEGTIDTESFVAMVPPPPWGPIGEEVYRRTYARKTIDPETGEVISVEEWADTCRRVVLGNLGFAPADAAQPDEAIELFELVYRHRLLPAGRHLWVTGTAVSKLSRNCFAGETEVLTRLGTKQIADLVGQTVEILDGSGHWVEAPCNSYGEQPLRKITLTRNGQTKTVYATGDHGWFTRSHPTKTGMRRTTTDELVAGQRLVNVYPNRRPSQWAEGSRPALSPVGVQHGFVYGDGTLEGSRFGNAVAYFCGPKDEALLPWFHGFKVSEKASGVKWATGLPRAFKTQMPDIEESSSYIYGFLAGLFAADGDVKKRGNVRLHSADIDGLRYARDLCTRIGVRTFSITTQSREGIDGAMSDIHTLTFDPHSLTEDFFLIPEHRQRWSDHVLASEARQSYWNVVSVESTDRVETVYCFEVPTTHSFALSDNLLTSNCWVSGWEHQLSAHFRFLAARLFEGGGVGANYSADLREVTAPLVGTVEVTYSIRADHPDFAAVTAVAPDHWAVENPAVAMASGITVITVADTREGWVDAYSEVIDAATRPGHHKILVDVSGVRHHGAELRTFGGFASGPAPLVEALVGIAAVLNRAGGRGRQLGGLESMEIDHLIAQSVVAGGARRSARLAAMHWGDPEVFDFIGCKSDGRSHWSANISVEIDEGFRLAVHAADEHAVAVLVSVAKGMATNGEPGLIDTDLMSRDEPRPIRITNPCVAGDSWVQTTSGLRQVRDLLGAGQVDLLVNDEVWSTGAEGFFETGTKPVLRLDVDGTALRVTADHLISTPDGWRPAGDLTAGDVVDLTDSLGNTWDGPGTEAEGYLLGHLAGDGSFLTGTGGAELAVWDQDGHGPEIRARLLELIETAGLRHRSDWEGWHAKTGDDEGKWVLRSAALRDLATRFGIARGTKTITPEVMAASSEFVTGFLRGLFDTDGHVEGTSTGSGITVRLSQSDAEMLGNARILLLALGIKSAIRSMKPAGSKDLPGGTYEVRESFRLIISGLHTERFAKLVGFEHIAKQSKLTDGIETMTKGFYSKPMVGTVQAITTDGVEPVYDCQVPGLNAFVANGTIVHNCGEATLSTDGAEGESCNLGSVNLDAYGTDFAGARRGFELMARFLYRATMNHHPDPSVGRIEERNRRLGVGFMGMQGWCAAHGVRLTDFAGDEALRTAMISFRLAARDAADDLADSMGLPRPVKVTAVAPVGTISQIPGTQPGLHPVKARYFIRRVRFAGAEPGWRDAQAQGYRVVDDVYAADTKVVEFIVKDSVLDRFDEDLIEQSNEVTAAQFFELVAAVQETFCGPGDGQAVSATGQIPVGTDPADLVMAIVPWLGRLKGVTVFPDKSFDLPPYEPLTRDEYEARIAELVAGAELAAGDSNDGSCSTGACPIR